MNEKQRAMLLDVISEWADIIHESAAAARMAQFKADINETWFAWSGPTTARSGEEHHGLLPDSRPTSGHRVRSADAGGDPSMHVHTMYRDPTNDYGREARGKVKAKVIAAAAIFSVSEDCVCASAG